MIKFCKVCLSEFEASLQHCPNDGSVLIEMRERGPLSPGIILDERYQIVKEIGRGGFGSIFSAYQFSTDRIVAIKVLSKDFSNDPSIVQRFVRESKTLAKLSHPNIVMVFESGRTLDGQLYIVMEFLEGTSLNKLMREKIIPLNMAMEITIQICDALSEAHSKGIVHRDLKPENIFVEEKSGMGNVVKVLDFGIAKIIAGEDSGEISLTKTGIAFGTADYMSPEQARGKRDLDYKTDIYSLGVVVYEMIAGQRPFGEGTPLELLWHHINDFPPSFGEVKPELHIPKKIDDLIMACLEKDTEKRPVSTNVIKDMIVDCFYENDQLADKIPSRELLKRSFHNMEEQLKEKREEPKPTQITGNIKKEVAPAPVKKEAAPVHSTQEDKEKKLTLYYDQEAKSKEEAVYLKPLSLENAAAEDRPETNSAQRRVTGHIPEKKTKTRLSVILVSFLLVFGIMALSIFIYNEIVGRTKEKPVIHSTHQPHDASGQDTLKKNLLEVTISSEPKGAEVHNESWVKKLGTTEFKLKVDIRDRFLILNFRKDGYIDKAERFDLSRATTTLAATLEKKKEEYGGIIIKSIPAGAKVYHRETLKYQGTTNFKLTLKKTDPKIPLVIKSEGYEDSKLDINPQDKQAEVLVNLPKSKVRQWVKPPPRKEIIIEKNEKKMIDTLKL